jgi:pimeloyl-ACP methyl ester carboxylesterase
MWRRIAPALARRFAVICVDLRGCGDSGCPPSDDTHAPYAKRAMAQDLVALMDHLGYAADRAAGRRIGCPVLALWAEGGPLDTWYADAGGPLGLWQTWCRDVQGRAIDGGHFFAETRPDQTSQALEAFLV